MNVKLESLEGTAGDKDQIQYHSDKLLYFTIGKGKAKYHMFYLADNSCGLYYAVRMNEDGTLCCRRAVEPTQKVVYWGHGLRKKVNDYVPTIGPAYHQTR